MQQYKVTVDFDIFCKEYPKDIELYMKSKVVDMLTGMYSDNKITEHRFDGKFVKIEECNVT